MLIQTPNLECKNLTAKIQEPAAETDYKGKPMPDKENTQTSTAQSEANPPKQPPPPPIISTVVGLNPASPHPENVPTRTETQIQATPKWFRKSEWWMVISNAILITVGVVTIGYFSGQLTAMKNANKLLADQMQQAAKDSKESAAKVEKTTPNLSGTSRLRQRQRDCYSKTDQAH